MGLSTLLNQILPYRCVSCNQRSDQSRDLCSDCEIGLPWIISGCRCCGITLERMTESGLCGDCILTDKPFDQTIAIFRYTTPFDQWVSALKFGKNLLYARLLGELMADAIAKRTLDQTIELPECLIPVPLYEKRYLERSFNQAYEIGLILHQQLGIEVKKDLCIRIKDTQPQSNLSQELRDQNMRNAFQIVQPIPYSHVAILDDVITTTNTVSELAKLLKASGVKRVDVWGACKTHLRG
jgi:ComF family protein